MIRWKISICSAVLLCVLFNRAILRLIFGSVEADVMEAAVTYFFYTALSFPFLALYNGGAAICRAQGNSKRPMLFSDWAIRGVIFTWRFHSRKWLSCKVV